MQANALASALLQRVDQRTATNGTLKIPAVPALKDFYVDLCAAVFSAAGRTFSPREREQASQVVETALGEAFCQSPRSKIVLRFEALPGCTLGYEVQPEVSSIAEAYERWIGTSVQPLFGTHPDARLWSLAEQMSRPETSPVLDLGAGTGRNAFALARRGHPVDAVEITPKFAEMISTTAAEQNLPIRVLVKDVLADGSALRRDYQMFFASEVVPDFRGIEDLRRLFVLASGVLQEGGLLVFNVHLAALGYTPDRAAREFAQQCYSALYTPSEIAAAARDLPFSLVSNDSVHDYELEHLPAEAWPPTPWFVNWSLGLDVFETDRVRCPVELRWLVFRKEPASRALGLPSTHTQAALDASSIAQQRARRFEPGEVRRALLRRLTRRWQASGSFTFPAVPALLERYLGQCLKLFEALGRHYADEQRREARGIFERVLQEAFTRSPRSNILVNYEAPMGTELHYAVTADAVSVTDMYEDWLERLPSPLFGDYPDARLSVLLRELGPERKLKVLDLGAGTGRNALYLAGLGHSVVAVESAPKLADLLRRAAAGSGLSLQVHTLDLFEQLASDPEVYSLIIMSGVASDLRRVEQLRYLFSLASQRLAPGGHLMLSLHVAVRDYAPDTAARQWAQQCCAMFFTREEIVSCTKESGLALGSDDSVCEFESAHLPVQAWPPTPAYVEWITCQHLFALPPERCPVELRWLVYHKPVT